MPTTIRIRDETRDRLQALSAREQRPVSAIVQDAVLRYDDARFWADFRREVASEAADHPTAWALHRADTAAWDDTLTDALTDGPGRLDLPNGPDPRHDDAEDR
ncbi:MAG TPA: hypothetical protein VGT61_00330 [Thermomicrobiales bacterium]|nr:hypothetical protein [Thermomicrobiales bacterium]